MAKIDQQRVLDALRTMPLNEAEVRFMADKVVKGAETLLAAEPGASDARISEVVDDFLDRLGKSLANQDAAEYRGTKSTGGHLEGAIRSICPIWPFC